MKSLLTLILVFCCEYAALATAQYPDKILYDGKEYNLHSNPLELYFEKYPDKRPQGEIRSSALWRGYVATFEVKNNQLYVKDIEIKYMDSVATDSYPYKWRSVFKEVFPDNVEIKIDWLRGILVLPHGEVVNYVHMGYGSTYENYILLEIDQGLLKKEKHFNFKEYEEFKEKQFQAFKQTEEYKKIKDDLKKHGSSNKYIDGFLRSFVTEYTSKILIE